MKNTIKNRQKIRQNKYNYPHKTINLKTTRAIYSVNNAIYVNIVCN